MKKLIAVIFCLNLLMNISTVNASSLNTVLPKATIKEGGIELKVDSIEEAKHIEELIIEQN